jgi:putative transposase
MNKLRFSEERMVKILGEADTAPVTDVGKKHRISDQTTTCGVGVSDSSSRPM